MDKTVKIHCTNTQQYVEVATGSDLLEVLDLVGYKSQFPIVNAKVNNKTESLDYCVYGNKTVTYVGIDVSSGMRSYVRSLCFLLVKAAGEVMPGVQLNIEHPVSLGYFSKLIGIDSVDQKTVDAIKAKMREYIDADLPFVSVEDETVNVVQLFRSRELDDKALLIETSGSLYSKYYRFGESVNYFYGSLVPSSGCLKVFGLEAYHDGLLLRIPQKNNPSQLEPVIDQVKMLNVYREHLYFLNILGLSNVADLNIANQAHEMHEIIKVSEALQEKNIINIAAQIAERATKGTRIILVSGPSSSGKTTFRMRLEVQLRANLLKPVGLSLDDYFVDRDATPLDENGGYDFESLYALDIPKFNDDLNRLLKGERVALPSFNFTTGKREYKGHELQLEEHNILVIEGIHGLNPDLTASIADDKKFKVYVSALTAVSLDNHNWIPPSDNRLLRRLIRDFRYRNYTAIDTLSRWPSVRKGEEEWIYPFQENADVMFNSAMIYELAALRKYAEPILLQVPNNVPEYAEAHRLLRFLSYFNYISDKELPPTSLLREFLGGSSFRY